MSPPNSPNTDGIDVWSPYVNILNCNISCGDDNIAMNNNTKYVTITGCKFGRGHGLSIGSYTSNIDHIYVNNCTFDSTDNGVHIKSSRDRSGIVAYLTYSNLTMTKVGIPINICEYYPDNTIPATATADPGQPVTVTTPVWKYIMLKNLTITGSNSAGLLWSVPEMHMKDLFFDNVNISATTGMKMNNVDSAAFINGSKITVRNGNAFVSTSASTITGINLITGLAQ
jgi:polygalacturonase